MAEGKQKVDLTLIWLAGILGIAAVIRIIYLIELCSTPFFRHPVLDAQYYLSWGGKLAWSGFRVFPEFQGNPLYPYFLAFLIRGVHAGPLLIRIVQHGLGIITCLLIFRASRLLFGRKTGLLAALFYAIYIPAVFYEGWFLTASLTAFLSAALLCSLLSAGQDFRISNWIGSGLIAGLLFLARPTLLPAGAFLWIVFTFKENNSKRRQLFRKYAGLKSCTTSIDFPVSRMFTRALLFLAGILVIIMPASIYFSLSAGEAVFFSSHGGENFYIGNNPEATGAGRIPDFARGTPALQHDDFIREAGRRTGRDFTPGENSRFWFREGIKFIAAHPFVFLKLLVLKIYLFFSANAISDNYHLPFFKSQLPILRLPFSWHALSTLGILGMIAGWRRRKKTAILYILTISYVLSVAIFFIASRFRLPTAPYLAIFGAFGVSSVFEAIRQKNIKTAAGLIMAAVLIFIGLGILPEATPIDASYLSAGEIYYRDADYDHARSYLEKARDLIEEEVPVNKLRSYRIHYALGQAYLGLDEPEKAAGEFQRMGTEVSNNLLEPDFDIGNAYAAHKFYREAKERYLALLEAIPDHFRAWNNLGMVYKEEGDNLPAAEAFTEAIRINPDYAAPHINRGNLYVQEGRYEEALNEFRAARRIDPALPQLYLSSAFCLQKLNRLAEAEAELRRCPAALRRKK